MIVEPDEWTVVFHRQSVHWWVNALPGRYKHVSAVTFVASCGLWLFYDVELGGTRLMLVADAPSRAVAQHLPADADLVAMPVRRRAGRLPPLLPFSCVSAVAHLIGARGALFRPDALWRYCRDNGGVWINGPKPGTSASAAVGLRSDGICAGGGAGRQR